jgi:predicted secreted protein
MKPNVVLKALARLAASAVALLVLLLVPAMAAERALLNVIGYDKASNYFAFEEFGMSDGTGGYYDHIFVIDLKKDAWVKGAPFSYADESEDAGMTFAQVRAKAMELAQPTLKKLGIVMPAQILAFNGDGERGNREDISWYAPNCCGVDSTEDTEFTVTLTEMPIAKDDAGDCADWVENGLVGFTLAYTDGTDKSELHSDGGPLPKSRGCTLGYGIYAVVQNFETGDGRIAIIETWPSGFEGPDRRFIAVPIDGHI